MTYQICILAGDVYYSLFRSNDKHAAMVFFADRIKENFSVAHACSVSEYGLHSQCMVIDHANMTSAQQTNLAAIVGADAAEPESYGLYICM
jgi:hypothetical protein